MNTKGNVKAPEETDFHRELQCTGGIDVDIIESYMIALFETIKITLNMMIYSSVAFNCQKNATVMAQP